MLKKLLGLSISRFVKIIHFVPEATPTKKNPFVASTNVANLVRCEFQLTDGVKAKLVIKEQAINRIMCTASGNKQVSV
jgi:hypothetical protein